MISDYTYTFYSGDCNRTGDKTQAFVHANIKGSCPATYKKGKITLWNVPHVSQLTIRNIKRKHNSSGKLTFPPLGEQELDIAGMCPPLSTALPLAQRENVGSHFKCKSGKYCIKDNVCGLILYWIRKMALEMKDTHWSVTQLLFRNNFSSISQ